MYYFKEYKCLSVKRNNGSSVSRKVIKSKQGGGGQDFFCILWLFFLQGRQNYIECVQ